MQAAEKNGGVQIKLRMQVRLPFHGDSQCSFVHAVSQCRRLGEWRRDSQAADASEQVALLTRDLLVNLLMSYIRLLDLQL